MSISYGQDAEFHLVWQNGEYKGPCGWFVESCWTISNNMSLVAIKMRLVNDGFHSDQQCIQDLTTIFDNLRMIYKPKQERDNANEFERCFFARLNSLP